VIDDDVVLCTALTVALADDFTVEVATSGPAGLVAHIDHHTAAQVAYPDAKGEEDQEGFRCRPSLPLMPTTKLFVK
jgi:hypothetical protein